MVIGLYDWDGMELDTPTFASLTMNDLVLDGRVYGIIVV